MCLHLKPLVISFDTVAFLDTTTTYSDNCSTFYPTSIFYAIIIYFQIDRTWLARWHKNQAICRLMPYTLVNKV